MLPILARLMQRTVAPLVAPKHPNHEYVERARGGFMERAESTRDDIDEAFRDADFRGRTDETLCAYPQFLCSEQYAQAHEQVRANSRCIRINAELMSRHAGRISRQASVLAVVAVLLAVGQLVIVLLAWPR